MRLEEALPFVDFYILHQTRNLDLEDAHAKAAAAATILDKIALLADRVAQFFRRVRGGRLDLETLVLHGLGVVDEQQHCRTAKVLAHGASR